VKNFFGNPFAQILIISILAVVEERQYRHRSFAAAARRHRWHRHDRGSKPVALLRNGFYVAEILAVLRQGQAQFGNAIIDRAAGMVSSTVLMRLVSG